MYPNIGLKKQLVTDQLLPQLNFFSLFLVTEQNCGEHTERSMGKMIHVNHQKLNRRIKLINQEKKLQKNDMPKSMNLPCEFCRILSTWMGTSTVENPTSANKFMANKNERNSVEKAESILEQNLLKPNSPPNCDECGMSFFDKTNLNRHIRRIHEGFRAEKVKCDHCGKFYVNKYR